MRRATAALLACALGLAALAGCGHDRATAPAPVARTFRMGFSAVPPRADPGVMLQALGRWASRADAALILHEPPWGELLRGVPPDSLVRRDDRDLAAWYRAHGLRLWVSIDPTNGLNRAAEAESLAAHGRSLAEPGVRALYAAYCVAVDTLLRPAWLGLASETNLVRAAAPPAVYQAMVEAAAAAAAAVRGQDGDVHLFSTVQVETAWGRLPAAGGYVGIAQDRADFAFADGLGLSSYPYFAWPDPDSLPADYYARLAADLPLFVIEGGWTSASLPAFGVTSTPALQARSIRRQAALLDRARALGWFQITFTDLDLAALPPATADALRPFATNGLVTATLAAKPALPEWDAVHRRPWTQP
jgi:hypothetical protein